jgi:fructan beta-fructosidase
LVSVGSGAPNGGSGTQYFVGRFDGREFTPDASVSNAARWVDYGTDDYAGSTWSGVTPGDRQLFIGWMSNWEYANLVPTQPWRSAMTVPRTLTLSKTPAGTELRSLPVAELAALRTDSNTVGRTTVPKSFDLTPPRSSSGLLDLDVKLNTRRAGRVDLVFSNAQNQRTIFRINHTEHRYEVDRTASGAIDFSPKFASVQTAPIVGQSAHIAVRAILDRSSVEIFINDGETVFTTIVFPSTPYDKITLESDKDIEIEGSTVYSLQSIWNETSGSGE